MAKTLNKVDELKKYFEGVISRADHHAGNVKEIAYSLLGVIVLKKDEGTDISVMTTGNDRTGNILWVHIGGKRYAFRYEHNDGTIEIRKDSYKGDIVIKIDNSTSLDQILGTF
jgi:hypothetical protein